MPVQKRALPFSGDVVSGGRDRWDDGEEEAFQLLAEPGYMVTYSPPPPVEQDVLVQPQHFLKIPLLYQLVLNGM